MTIKDNNDVRKLITLRKIDKLVPIDGADKIESAVIGGWHAIVKKNEFKVGDDVLYFEIDSFLPEGVPQFAFLTEKSSKKALNGDGKEVKGHVLKTIRLRGSISQGLILSPTKFDGLDVSSQESINDYFAKLGVFKYEKPLPADGSMKGTYPSHTRKTDSERVQNLSDDYLKMLAGEATWAATEKLDGSSATFWKDEDGKLRVASRNYELDLENAPLFKQTVERLNLNDILQPGETLKGEHVGPGLNGNKLKLNNQDLVIFDWESPTREIPVELEKYIAPVYDLPFPTTVEEAVAQADKLESLYKPGMQAEGIVWWNIEGKEFKKLGYRPNFKAINNSYLLKNGE